MTAKATAAASDIPVKALRQCFVWPLILSEPAGAGDWFKNAAAAMPKEGWEAVPEPLDLEPEEGGVGPYEEAVYFHDFVRDLLYARGPDAPMRVFRRPAMRRLTATIDGAPRPFVVETCALALHRSGVALLTLALRYDGPSLTLAQAQTMIDRLRRAYAPFWSGPGQPGLCPTGVEIDGKPHGLGSLENRDVAEAELRCDLREPLFPWWAAILHPLAVEGAGGTGPHRMRQVLDERIPLMTTLSLSRDGGSAADLEAVSEGDWRRLAFADPAGKDASPYNPDFLKRSADPAFYDRFAPHKDTDRDGVTRFAFAGYHVLAAGAGWFFDNRVTQHMRRHYRRMMEMCVLEFATLLMLSSRLSRAARRRKDEAAFREEVVEIEKRFLDFTHAAHFTGVSNQLQAREIFAQMRASMGLDALYDDVKEELASASAFALALDQRDAARAAQRLTEVATVAAAVGVASGLAGMNILIGDPLRDWAAARFGLAGLGLDFGLVQFGLMLAMVSGGLWTLLGDATEQMKRNLLLLVAGGVLLVMFGAMSIWSDRRPKPQPAPAAAVERKLDDSRLELKQ